MHVQGTEWVGSSCHQVLSCRSHGQKLNSIPFRKALHFIWSIFQHARSSILILVKHASTYLAASPSEIARVTSSGHQVPWWWAWPTGLAFYCDTFIFLLPYAMSWCAMFVVLFRGARGRRLGTHLGIWRNEGPDEIVFRNPAEWRNCELPLGEGVLSVSGRFVCTSQLRKHFHNRRHHHNMAILSFRFHRLWIQRYQV